MMSIENIIKSSMNDDTKELMFGIDKIVPSLVPNAHYGISVMGGNYVVTHWDENNQGSAPSSEEIKREYHRQETIVEFYNYLKNDQPEVYDLLMSKLGIK